ncbi:NAD-dependent epimerase/dehydratase family protein [Microvirga sp. G4-2]|uniref:NAD-dependent epimerase/dehydratase family protein n=1 Tax=Microvirga sp. G4-2 TaxID=3434467 RepID=UPI0040449FC4
MTTLITGGTGFVGLALAEALRRRDERVILLATAPPRGELWQRFGDEDVTFVRGDVMDPVIVRDVMNNFEVDRLVHAAAITPDADRERREAARIFDVNVSGTMHVVAQALRMSAMRRVIVLSSVAVYGFADPGPGGAYDEASSGPAPVSLYGISKLAAEQGALRLAALTGGVVHVVRLGPVFGPWEYATGLRDNLSPHRQLLDAAVQGKEAVLPRSMQADWLYSRDAGDALAALTTKEALAHPVYNVGGSRMSDAAEWCRLLDRRFPGFAWRVAEPGEAATVTYGLPRDRAPLAVNRLCSEIGPFASRSLADAALDMMEFLDGQDRSGTGGNSNETS